MSFQRPECSVKIGTKHNLERHISNIHRKEKPHKCEYCDFATNHKPNLKKHSCYIKKSNPITEGEETSTYSIEYNIQKRLENELNGHKVSCPFGRIDIMTADTIIEIKKWEDHKKGIGQILGYGFYFPLYKKRIHFFGMKPTDKQMRGILEVCKFYNIEITEE